MANVVIIAVIALLGIYAAYLTTALFTKHGLSTTVPGVENMSYTQAIEKLHEHGFRVDIRDSLYREDIKPGYVIEQFPKRGSTVKPGRKIFLYINAVRPKEVMLDDDNHPNDYALRGNSGRIAKAKLQELGFKDIRISYVLGADDRVVKVLANGRPVHKMEKVPLNARMVLEVSNGRLAEVQDSLQLLEQMREHSEVNTAADSGEEYHNASALPESEEPAGESSGESSEGIFD